MEILDLTSTKSEIKKVMDRCNRIAHTRTQNWETEKQVMEDIQTKCVVNCE